MTNPLLKKLSAFNKLSDDDAASLERAVQGAVRYRAGQTLIAEGARPTHVNVLIDGWAFRYKIIEDGRRQIMAYLLPGDLCDPHVFILERMDHAIGLLSDANVVRLSKEAVLEITEQSPAIGRALWWSALVDEAVLRHWLVNLGQRDAYDRIAHLFCELWARARQVDLVSGFSFDLPLTQEQLGDTVGLTSVHTNRVLQRMRGEGLISLESRRLTILDIDRLRAVAGFDPQYLHLRRAGGRPGSAGTA